MVTKGEFTVIVSRKEVIAAALPLQEHWLPFSNIDLLLPPLEAGLFFCYKKPESDNNNNNFASFVDVLKKSLAEVLVPYYALAGEIVCNSVGEPELLCNNRGVDFVEAYANVELRELNLYNPDESIEGKFMPAKNFGVISVQATELKCGGVVVACNFDHRIADLYSANLFLVSWTEIAQSKPISLPPCFRRSLLNPKRRRSIDPIVDSMYMPISKLPPPPTELQQASDDHIISRIYYVTNDKINEINSLASANGSKRTKFESFSAYLWKMVAECYGPNNEKVSKMGIAVDGRSRLSQGDNEKSKQMMRAYFGNVVSIPFGGEKINQLAENPLSWVAEKVHEFLETVVNEDHFVGLIDWVEMHRPEPALAKIYSNGSNDGPAFLVSSGKGLETSRVDFGWGKPVIGSCHFPWGGSAGYVMPMPSPIGNGDWVVYMHLQKKQLDFIEAEASDVFTPLTFEYLNSIISI
ncbi:putative HXXXD-type acyl-transferase family protein [Melia azedarach]|uniref:HXXXD-type acyl-transferase family protein n=1 Tax=Melia azedarach TaxID=155640 RepID=A0ACC1YKG7_MELAZ|nr:putative HXXXD-type acyl-transferase family protein [Melia azedarach]